MTGFLHKKFYPAAALLGASAIAGHAQTQSSLPIEAPDTITLYIISHKIEANGQASITVDASAMNNNKWAILTDRITKAAIVMPGVHNNRLCPFFDLSRYKHSIDQIEYSKPNFLIKAQITPMDVKKALENQCLIIKIPSARAINWKPYTP